MCPQKVKATAQLPTRAPATPVYNDRCTHWVPCQEARLTFPTGSSTLPLLGHRVLPSWEDASGWPTGLGLLPSWGQGQGTLRVLSFRERTLVLGSSPVSYYRRSTWPREPMAAGAREDKLRSYEQEGLRAPASGLEQQQTLPGTC